MPEFSKYKNRGAYHWQEVSSNIRRHNAFTVGRYEFALELAGELAGMNGLDVGAGDGALTSRIAQRGARVIGLDACPFGLAGAQSCLTRGKDGSIPLVLGSAVGLPLLDDSLDFVLSTEVIEHLPDYPLFLSECLRTLKPGGKLILTTPFRLSFSPQDKEHVREFFPEELAELVRSFGFQVENIQLSHPLFWKELYERRLFGIGVGFYLVNLASILGFNPFHRRPPCWRHWAMFGVVAKKPTSLPQPSSFSGSRP